MRERSEVLASLDAWLDRDDRPFALVLGPPEAGKTALLAHWAISVAERGTVEVAFLPVDRRLGTALERDALGLLSSLLPEVSDTVTPAGLRRDVWRELWFDRSPGELTRLVIVDGADRAEKWSVQSGADRSPNPGERVRLLISVDTREENSSGPTIGALCSQQGLNPEETEAITIGCRYRFAPVLPAEFC